MPVLDWARTDLDHPNPNGTTNLYFSYAEFAYFDIYIVGRAGAREEWAAFKVPGIDAERDILAEVESLRQNMTPEAEHKLVENIIVKTQGFVSGNIREDDERVLWNFSSSFFRCMMESQRTSYARICATSFRLSCLFAKSAE